MSINAITQGFAAAETGAGAASSAGALSGMASFAGPAGMAIAAAGMFMDWKAGQDAKDKARALRREQLIMHDMTAAENRRRTQMTQRQQTGAARAAAYASGTQYGGSTASYVDEMVTQFKHDLNWQDMTADQERKVIRRGGSAVTSGITSQSTGNLLAGGMGLLDRFTSLG